MKKYVCSQCGKEYATETKFCEACGSAITVTEVESVSGEVEDKKTNGMALAGFITSMASLIINLFGIVGLVGLILSIIGMVKIGKGNGTGKGFAIAGIIVGAFSVIYGLIMDLIAIIQILSLFA